jgi:hypothetical protein
MNRIMMLAFLILGFAKYSHAALIDQAGNLIENGNFETGSTAPWRTNDSPTINISTDRAVDGRYSAFVDTTPGIQGGIGDWVIGLWQYPGYTNGVQLPDGVYTVSAWFYAVTGQAHIGLAYGGGGFQHYSGPTSTLGQWQYLELTAVKTSLGGPVLFGLFNQDKFYVDGVWVNAGATNLSPYAPANGFLIPNPIPEPTILALLAIGLAGIALGRPRL